MRYTYENLERTNVQIIKKKLCIIYDKVDFPFWQSLLVDYLKIMNMELSLFASTVINNIIYDRVRCLFTRSCLLFLKLILVNLN
jgi:hypothetical protein